jgi:two-component sensor histidine kinase
MAVCLALAQNGAIAFENARLHARLRRQLNKQRQTEEALRRLNQELEQRIIERTEQLSNTNAQLAQEVSERARAEADYRQRNRELLSLQSAIAATASSLDLPFLLETVTWEMVKLLEVDGCTILEWDPDADTLAVIAEYGSTDWWGDGKAGKIYRVSDYPLRRQALAERCTQQLSLNEADPDLAEAAHMRSNEIQTLLILPMIFQARVVGLMEISQARAGRAFADNEITLGQLLANQAASAIENARLYKRAQGEIAERKRAEDMIRASLKEKEVLLQEIHHRVKNNLQVVSSLLNLQSGYVQDESAQQMFQESQNRILSMALIHERLYQSQDLARIDLSEYLQTLSAELIHSYRANAAPIKLKIDAEDVLLNIKKAVPCGLIVNELVSNALKHAFPAHQQNGKEPEVRIQLSADPQDRVTLIVSDNGVGFPKDVDLQTLESLGLRLVNTLITQLEGTLELANHDGTEFKLQFSAS